MVNVDAQGVIQIPGRGFISRDNNEYLTGEYKSLINFNINEDGHLVGRPSTVVCPPLYGPDWDPPVANEKFDKYIGNNQGRPIFNKEDGLIAGVENDAITDRDHEGIFWEANKSFIVPRLRNSQPDEDVLDGDGNPTPGYGDPVLYAQGLQSRAVKYGFHWTFDYYINYNNRAYMVAVFMSEGESLTSLYPDGEQHPFGLINVSVARAQKRFKIDNSFLPVNFSELCFKKIQEEMFYSPGDSDSGDSPRWPHLPAQTNYVKKCFVHKERLWIALGNIIYFSAATEPDNFTVPQGGFYKFPGEEIKDVVALGDNLYVFTDNTIKVITYVNDPNQDSTIKTITTSLGGESAVVVNNVIVFIKRNSIYSLTNNNPEKITDLYVGYDVNKISAAGALQPKLQVVGSAVYLSYSKLIRHPDAESIMGVPDRGNMFNYCRWGPNKEVDFSPIYRIDVETGTFSEYDVASSFSEYTGKQYLNGPVFSVLDEDGTNESRLFTTMIDPETEEFVVSYFHEEYDRKEKFFADEVWSEGIRGLIIPKTLIEISNISPDGFNYFIKKFRNLMLTGHFIDKEGDDNPDNKLKLWVDYGTEKTSKFVSVLRNRLGDESRANIFSERFGLNQRAKTMSIKISMDPFEWSLADFSMQDLVNSYPIISDIRLLWTYTQRAPVGNRSDKS